MKNRKHKRPARCRTTKPLTTEQVKALDAAEETGAPAEMVMARVGFRDDLVTWQYAKPNFEQLQVAIKQLSPATTPLDPQPSAKTSSGADSQNAGHHGREPMRRSMDLTAQQVQSLLAAADTEWKGMILLGLDTGGRLEDVANMRWRSVDMERREVRYVLRKTNHRLVVPMTADLYGHLASLTRPADPEAPVFPSCFKYAQEGYWKLAARFRRLQVKAGLEPVSFHSLRVTFIVALKRLGVPEDLIVQLVGCSPWWIMPARPKTKAEAVARLPKWVDVRMTSRT